MNADIRARVRGFLRTQDYKDGVGREGRSAALHDRVRRTTPRPCRRRRRPCRARRVAQSHNKIQADRYQGLFKTGMVSQQDLDNVTASVADADGQVQAAAAQLDRPTLNLSYTQIRSPDRRRRRARAGARREPRRAGRPDPPHDGLADRPDPRELPRQRGRLRQEPGPLQEARRARPRLGQEAVRAPRRAGTAEGGDPGVELVLSDGSVYPHKGVIVSVNRQIDPSTGTIQLQALVPNPDGVLRPGQYGRVRIRAAGRGQRRARGSGEGAHLRAGYVLGRRRRRRQQGSAAAGRSGPERARAAHHRRGASPRATASWSRGPEDQRRRRRRPAARAAPTSAAAAPLAKASSGHAQPKP